MRKNLCMVFMIKLSILTYINDQKKIITIYNNPKFLESQYAEDFILFCIHKAFN